MSRHLRPVTRLRPPPDDDGQGASSRKLDWPSSSAKTRKIRHDGVAEIRHGRAELGYRRP